MLAQTALAAGVTALTFLVLRGGWRNAARRLDLRPQGQILLMGVAAIAAAVWFYGPIHGVAIIIVVMIHEYGHVAAYRVAGHHDATFRLIPFFGGVAISGSPPRTQLHDFYVTIMGPGICLAAVGVAFLAVEMHFGYGTIVYDLFWYVAFWGCLLNFLNLLPLWPLDGGRIAYVLAYTLSPPLARLLLQVMAFLLLAASLFTMSLLLFFFGLMSLQGLAGSAALSARQQPLTPVQAIMGATAWGLMLAAFWIGGGYYAPGMLPF